MVYHRTIFFSVSNPFILRNFLVVPDAAPYRLLRKGIRVIVLVPRQAHDRVQKDFGDRGFIIEPIFVNWKKNVPQRAYTFFSSYLNMTDHQRLLAWCGIRNDIPVAGGKKFLYPAKLAVANTLGKWDWFRNTCIAALDPLVYRERPYKELFEKYKPDLVFLPDFHNVQDLALLREAKRQKVKTIGMPGSWDHFVKRYEPVKLDTLLVWNEPVKKEAVVLQGYKEENVYVTGSAYYDLFVRREIYWPREAFCEKFGLDPRKKIIFFISRGRYTPNDGEIVDIMLKAIKNRRLVAAAQIFVRPYPGINTEHPKFDQFENEPLVYTDWIEPIKIFGHSGFAWYPTLSDVIHFVNCLYHADIVINTFSSVSIEASVFLKPIINIFFDGYEVLPFERSVRRGGDFPHFRHVDETGGIFTVSNTDELINTINACFKDPDINRKKVEALRERMTFRADGKANERIAGHIINALS